MEPMSPSLQRLRDLVEQEHLRVIVSDLDGVLRVFDQSLWAELDQIAAVDPGTAFAAILGHPFLEEVTRGRGTHMQWRHLAGTRLVASGSTAEAARTAVERWASTPAAVDRRVLEEMHRYRDQGLAVFVLTNGTDRVPEELSALGLDAFLGEERRFLLNTADLGAAKPEPTAFARAKDRIEQVLGKPVRPAQIALLDDSARHVRGAESAGWHAILHRAG